MHFEFQAQLYENPQTAPKLRIWLSNCISHSKYFTQVSQTECIGIIMSESEKYDVLEKIGTN